MSAPSRYVRDAENIRYSFLAVKSQLVLEKVIKSRDLTVEDLEVLKKAKVFLEEIAEGAQLVSTGVYHGHNSLVSMKALQYAMNPLERLQSIKGDEEISEFFKEIADAVPVEAIKLDASEQDKIENISAACEFFAILYDSLSAAITETKKVIPSFMQQGRSNVLYGFQ